MKLFLSSIRLPSSAEAAELFVNKDDPSVVIVPNAWDTYPEDRRKSELADTIAQLKMLGYKTSVLDLVTSSAEQVNAALESSDFVWVMGGNTFHLRYLIEKTGFATSLKEALNHGLVYGGTSAGAVIAGATLHGAENVDDPNDAVEIIWDGLGLVDFGVVPHWGMEKYAAELAKMKEAMHPYVAQTVTLTNDDAAIIIDGEIKIASAIS